MRFLLDRLDGQGGHYIEILKGAAGSFSLRIAGALAGFLFNLEIARRLGPEGVGIYGLAVTTATLCATLALCGMGQAAIKLIAAEAARAAWTKVRQVTRAALLFTLPVSVILAAAMFLSRELIAVEVFREPRLGPILGLLSVAVVPLTLRAVAASCLNGLKRVKSAVTVDSVLQPVTALLLFYLFLDQDLVGAAGAFLAGTGATLLAGAWFWRLFMADKAADRTRVVRPDLLREMLAVGLPTLGVVFGLSFGQWVVIYVLGFAAGSAEVGFYRVAFQITILLGFLLTAADSIMAPKISALYHQGELQRLAQICRFAIVLMLLPGLPAVAILLLFPGPIVSIFGSEFGTAALALQILALGQLINLATGSVGTLLIMTGHQQKSLLNSLFGALAALVLSLLLIPAYGASGAAAALAITVALRNLSATFLVWRFVGVNVWTGTLNRHAQGSLA